jgi:hypothetical protein
MHRGGSWPWLYDNFQEVDSVRDSVADILHENCADEFLLALRLWVGDGSCGGCTERRSGVVQGNETAWISWAVTIMCECGASISADGNRCL